MDTANLPDHHVYSPPVIEFVTVVAETCLLLENTNQYSTEEFVENSIKLLSLLYFKTFALQAPERMFDQYSERFVTENDYIFVKEQVEVILGEKDSYLETFHPDMAISDTPIAAFISENLADIYQEIKDFAANYQLGETDIMNDALVTCIEAFAEHWGQKTLNALRALHNIKFGNAFPQDEYTPDYQDTKSIERNNFLDYLRDDE